MMPQPANSRATSSGRVDSSFCGGHGGAVDVVARELGRELSLQLGVNFIVENMGGAGGTIGAAKLAHAKPDGYTLMIQNLGLAISASLYQNLPYDTARDIAPVAFIGTSSNVLVVTDSFPAKSVTELIALAKSQPGTFNYGSAGSGSSSQIAMALFAAKTGISVEHVPYKGSGPAMVGLVAGQTQMMLQTTPAAIPLIKSGKLRALATSGARRSPALPSLPTIAESGVNGFSFSPWFGLFAPARTPAPILNKLHAAVNKMLGDPVVIAKFQQLDLDVQPKTREEFVVLYGRDIAEWAQSVKKLGIKAN